MFGRLKLALVALVLMPAAAFAADRHAPGASAKPAAVETKIAFEKPAQIAVIHQHRSSLRAIPAAPTTIALFLSGLGDDTVVATVTKQAAAAVSAPAATPERHEMHRPG